MSRLLTTRERCTRSRSAPYLVLVVSALLLAGALPARAQNSYPDRIDPYINDYAKVISAEDAGNIRQVLSDLKSSKGVELVVVTVNSIDDYDTGDTTIESFATHLFNTWGIGDAQRNDGLMLLVAIKDHKLRIELGRGYGSGHSPEMQSIIDNTIVPDFKQNAYSRGIYRGAKSIADQVSGMSVSTAAVLPTAQAANTGSRATSASTNPNVGGLIAVLIGLGAAIVFMALGLNQAEHRIPPKCDTCRVRMRRAIDDPGTAVLNPGQQQEAALNSVEHIVWKCPTCGTYQVRSYPRKSSASQCPKCRFVTVTRQETVNLQPTTSAAGWKTVSDECVYCHYHHTGVAVLPMIGVSSGDGGDWGGGGDSGGGGGSDGGGASGSW
jgi:uncharacterized protein